MLIPVFEDIAQFVDIEIPATEVHKRLVVLCGEKGERYAEMRDGDLLGYVRHQLCWHASDPERPWDLDSVVLHISVNTGAGWQTNPNIDDLPTEILEEVLEVRRVVTAWAAARLPEPLLLTARAAKQKAAREEEHKAQVEELRKKVVATLRDKVADLVAETVDALKPETPEHPLAPALEEVRANLGDALAKVLGEDPQ